MTKWKGSNHNYASHQAGDCNRGVGTFLTNLRISLTELNEGECSYYEVLIGLSIDDRLYHN